MAGRVSRGDVWMYEFGKPDKLRPVVVLTRDTAIELLHSVLVAPVTSTIHGISSEVLVGEAEGLKRPSSVKLDNLQSVERARLRRFVGSLGAEKMRLVCRALAVAVGCD